MAQICVTLTLNTYKPSDAGSHTDVDLTLALRRCTHAPTPVHNFRIASQSDFRFFFPYVALLHRSRWDRATPVQRNDLTPCLIILMKCLHVPPFLRGIGFTCTDMDVEDCTFVEEGPITVHRRHEVPHQSLTGPPSTKSSAYYCTVEGLTAPHCLTFDVNVNNRPKVNP